MGKEYQIFQRLTCSWFHLLALINDVALAVINAISDDDFFGIFTTEQIDKAVEKSEGATFLHGTKGGRNLSRSFSLISSLFLFN